MKWNKKSPVEAPVLFEIDPEPIQGSITASAGLTLVDETFRGLRLGLSANRQLDIKQRQRGFDEGTYLESFVLLNAAGGDCLDDFEQLREDQLWPISSATAMFRRCRIRSALAGKPIKPCLRASSAITTVATRAAMRGI